MGKALALPLVPEGPPRMLGYKFCLIPFIHFDLQGNTWEHFPFASKYVFQAGPLISNRFGHHKKRQTFQVIKLWPQAVGIVVSFDIDQLFGPHHFQK